MLTKETGQRIGFQKNIEIYTFFLEYTSFYLIYNFTLNFENNTT